jgi:rubrerythrin
MPKEYIEREAIKSKAYPFPCAIGVEYAVPLRAINEEPTADVVEVKHGKWIKDKNRYTCSECGFYYFANNSKSNYCPNCGAKMDKE